MVDNSSASTSNDEYELKEIRILLWGSNIRLDVFRRWSQGFEFSSAEPSALIQKQGGPCALIAPVQAFLLKTLLMETPGYNFRDLTCDKCKRLLIQALCNILMKCKDFIYRLVILPESYLEAKEEQINENSEGNLTSKDDLTVNDSPSNSQNHPSCHLELSPKEFHERLSVINFEKIEDVEKYYSENFDILGQNYGILLFMYTVLLTKGIDKVIYEISDVSEPLIHNTYGYGSQALINLMLTGRAVAHVWDNEQDVGGLKLRGIDQQSDIGFITLMEQMRYCTVGSFYKNPKNPVWVMGSETHLTVLFSNEKRLVSPETPCEIAKRVFKSYDPDGNNFIASTLLQDVLCSLNLVHEPEYVDIMRKKLDPDNFGIILLNGFMEEFFPEDKRSMPDTFDLMHYNGIPGSNASNMVRYCKGTAILLECDLKSMCSSSNLVLTCLQTKWPNIEVNWQDGEIPSLN